MLLAALFLAGSGLASPGGGARVLLISSYHPGFPTFKDQVAGIRSVLDPAFVAFDYEFMESKRLGDAKGRDVFRHMLAHKLDHLPPYDCLIAADDNALAFLLAWGDSLQPGVPVVFFGINSAELADRAQTRRGYTGILEAVSMGPTLNLMTRLQPEARRLVAIVDGTPSGQADLATFLQKAPAFPGYEFEVLSLTTMDFGELGRRLQTLGDDCSILLLSAYYDSSGRRVLFQEGMDIILQNANLPVFHLWHHGVGDGLLGGVVISHEQEGRQAALKVLRILAGEPAETIPLLQDSTNRTVVDDRIMKRFGLNPRFLPADTIILNRPDNLLERYRFPILIVVLCMGLLLSGVLFLARMNQRLRRTQNRLRESEMRYSGLFSDAHLVMLLVNSRDGRILEANQAACRFYGYTAEQILRLRIDDLQESGEQDHASRNKPTHFTTRHRSRSGEIRDVEVHAAPIVIDGQLMLYGIVHDITEQRRAENEREELTRQLQHVAKLEAIGNLAGGIAHDFNNFLTIIHGHADLLAASQRLLPDQHASVQAILKTTRTAGELVRKILDFSRPGDEDLQVLDPAPVVRDSLRMLRTSFPGHIHIREEIAAEAGPILAHPTQISQIVMNLGTNAMHAMEATGGTLTVRLDNTRRRALTPSGHPLPGTQEFLRLEFTDTGHGIPEKIRNEIFNPYFTTKEYGKGTGMGLAILHGLIRGYEGSIEVESQEGLGSTFSVYLPVSRSLKKDPAACP